MSLYEARVGPEMIKFEGSRGSGIGLSREVGISGGSPYHVIYPMMHVMYLIMLVITLENTGGTDLLTVQINRNKSMQS